MPRISKAVGLALALATSLLAHSAGALAADESAGRYTMTGVKDGVIRMDTRTGVMTFCRVQETGWLCEALRDDTSRLIAERERLEAENAELASEVKTLKEKLLKTEEKLQATPGKEAEGSQPALDRRKAMDEMRSVLEDMINLFRDTIESRTGTQSERRL